MNFWRWDCTVAFWKLLQIIEMVRACVKHWRYSSTSMLSHGNIKTTLHRFHPGVWFRGSSGFRFAVSPWNIGNWVHTAFLQYPNGIVLLYWMKQFIFNIQMELFRYIEWQPHASIGLLKTTIPESHYPGDLIRWSRPICEASRSASRIR